MSEGFKPIETQEELNAIIQKRVDQAKRSAEQELGSKYADYEDLKQKAAQVDSLTSELETQKQRIAELEPYETKCHSYEIDSVKTRVAMEEGLPYAFAARLTGEDEETIRSDAKEMAKLIGNQNAPLGGSEPIATTKDAKDKAYLQLARELGKGD